MTHSLALTVSVLLAGALPALAQSHPPTHARDRQHDQSSHDPLDPAQHAAMHTLLVGNWTGISIFPGAVSKKLNLAVRHDKTGNVTLTMTADRTVHVGAASEVALDGSTLQWTQAVGGTPCHVTAVVNAPTQSSAETLKGTMACEQGEIAFTLQKTKA
jgi:hypothetical protein